MEILNTYLPNYETRNLNKKLSSDFKNHTDNYNNIKHKTPDYKFYNNFINFNGNNKKPFTDEDYRKARAYFEEALCEISAKSKPKDVKQISLSDFDLNKLDGIQKDIEVFEGLSMKEINFILNKSALLLNRGCNNMCQHCCYSATPYTQKTQDRMSYEDFMKLNKGIEELYERLDKKINIYNSYQPLFFLDSDCIDIELTDKDGNIHDYMDCVKDANLSFSTIFDTSGWDVHSEKHQKRAEKLVDSLLNPQNDLKIGTVSISFNPYHSLYAKSVENRHNFKFIQAKQLKDKYIERMANALFTFTPLIQNDFDIGVLARVLSDKKSKSKHDEKALYALKYDILKKLEKMYIEDLQTNQKYVKNKEEIEALLNYCKNILSGTEECPELLPWGRAKALYKNPKESLDDRKEKLLSRINNSPNLLKKGINPNGSIILYQEDVSARTNLQLNFDNKDKQVKPFASEIEEYEYKFDE